MNHLECRLYVDGGEVGNAKTNSFPIGTVLCEGRMTKKTMVWGTMSFCNHNYS